MAIETGRSTQRRDVSYFEGLNRTVGHNIGKPQEFTYLENVRCVKVGTIEKREGQTQVGVGEDGDPFVTDTNYGLFYFDNDNPDSKGLYRASELSSKMAISYLREMGVGKQAVIINGGSGYTNGTYTLSGGHGSGAQLTVTTNAGIIVGGYISSGGTDYIRGDRLTVTGGNGDAMIEILTDNEWTTLSGAGINIEPGLVSTASEGKNLFLTNFYDNNRYIKEDGLTVVDSTDPTGHLYSSPRAHHVNFYKGRIYLANYEQDDGTGNTIHYPTSVMRSSYELGIIALINGDNPNNPNDTTPVKIPNYSPPSPVQNNPVGLTGSTRLEVTDNKYFYSVTGANEYEIYRGYNKIADIEITQVNETSIDVDYEFVSGTTPEETKFLSSDEIWIKGTYTGDKIFRWMNNSAISGRNVKQYDTFKLSGGDNDGITMLTNIGNVMLVGNKNSLSSWNDYTLENFDLGVGCVSPKGYVKTTGQLFFLHYSGIYMTSGGVPQIKSNKIEDYIFGATKEGLENAAAGKKHRSVFFTIGDVTLYNDDGSIQKIARDVCLEYNLTTENWYVHTNVSAVEFATFLEFYEPDRLVFISNKGENKVLEFLNGTTDDGVEVYMRADMHAMTLQSQYENKNNLNSLIIESERGTSTKIFVSTTEEIEWHELEGTVSKGISVLKFNPRDDDRGTPVQCRILKISIRDSSKQRPVISRLSVLFTPDNSPSELQ